MDDGQVGRILAETPVYLQSLLQREERQLRFLSLTGSAPELAICLIRVLWFFFHISFLGDFDNDTAPLCHQPHYSHKLKKKKKELKTHTELAMGNVNLTC